MTQKSYCSYTLLSRAELGQEGGSDRDIVPLCVLLGELPQSRAEQSRAAASTRSYQEDSESLCTGNAFISWQVKPVDLYDPFRLRT